MKELIVILYLIAGVMFSYTYEQHYVGEDSLLVKIEIIPFWLPAAAWSAGVAVAEHDNRIEAARKKR